MLYSKSFAEHISEVVAKALGRLLLFVVYFLEAGCFSVCSPSCLCLPVASSAIGFEEDPYSYPHLCHSEAVLFPAPLPI